jgi:putative transposase
MPRKQPDLHRADELLDELLADCPSPEAILGKSGLLKQLTQRLVERALAGELNWNWPSPEIAKAPSSPSSLPNIKDV